MNTSNQKGNEDGLVQKGLIGLSVAALGIVFGDIGTSPLYAIRECFHGSYGVSVNEINVLGVLSLITWIFILIISVKYMFLLLKTDLEGEGGVLALTLLVLRKADISPRRASILLIGLAGTSLMVGDAAITPAISVLSAVEGLTRINPNLNKAVVPLTIVIISALFLLQKRGTGQIGIIFGPIMLVWFLILAGMGVYGIVKCPSVLRAINPLWAFRFFVVNSKHAFIVLGAVFLVITGAEAMYADLAHFGKMPIRMAWFFIAFPCLLLNYFGQGALLLSSENVGVENLFFKLVPVHLTWPVVIIATVATIIASQAVITGMFSLIKQAVSLGFWPRVSIIHTSSRHIGQIYVPFANYALFTMVLLLILGFRDSGKLAGAYGIAVSATMLLTGLLFSCLLGRYWNKRRRFFVLLIMFVVIVTDTAFLLSNFVKIKSGGWVVVLIAAIVFLIMSSWKKGRDILRDNVSQQGFDIVLFVKDVAVSKPLRVPGTAVFLSSNWRNVPRALLHNIKHNRVLHEQTVILSVKTENVPFVSETERVEIIDHGEGIYAILIKYGFREYPNLPKVLSKIKAHNLKLDPARTTFFLGKETLVFRKKSSMSMWRRRLFAFLSHNASNPALFFGIPPNRVVELGLQVEL